MAYKTLQLRRDTAANWTSNNPTLLSGEPGFVTDTGKLKIGDGTSAWSNLGYIDSHIDHDSLTNVHQDVTTSASPTFAGLTLTGNLIVPDGGTIGQSAGPLLTFDDANNKLNISGCNVGIGTTAGDSRLIVSLDTDFPNEPTDPPVMEIAGNSQLALLFSSTKSCYIKGDYDGNFVMGAEGFVAYETGGFGWAYERMRITPDGKVGIGTQNPNSLLDVAGDANIDGNLDVTDEIITASYIEVGGPIPGGLTGASKLFIDTETSTGKSRFFCYGKDATTRGQFEILLRESDEGNTLQAFLIDSDGNITIGAALSINSTLTVSSTLTTNSYIGIGGSIPGGLTGANKLFIDVESSTGKSRLWCYGKNTTTRGQFEVLLRESDEGATLQVFFIDSDGDVHIPVIKSGATQAAAGAAAGELWKTNGHASLPNNVVMIGV